ncbi:hypothetical protein AQI70_08980 [Streptomyces curacoi]|uniref:Uncharacterized protein n=2 Tax=Streptomyces curacoi TaxID=146536 RepID=A0A117PH08_9ACTN|nr:hypothetical protein AQI70_08980 [Streptomyces curacoi]
MASGVTGFVALAAAVAAVGGLVDPLPALILVVRAKGKDFAVSVDDAERGAALLNSLSAKPLR